MLINEVNNLNEKRVTEIRRDIRKLTRMVSDENFNNTKILHIVASFKEIPANIDEIFGKIVIAFILKTLKKDGLSNPEDVTYKNLLIKIKEDKIKEVEIYFVDDNKLPENENDYDFTGITKLEPIVTMNILDIEFINEDIKNIKN